MYDSSDIACPLGQECARPRTFFSPMSLLPESASFEEQVQDLFLAYRGSGVMLSALDNEILSEWATWNVPLEAIARGIRRAAEVAFRDRRRGEPTLQSLRSCRKQVNAEIKKFVDRNAGRGGSEREAAHRTLEQERVHRLGTALRKLRQNLPEFANRLDTLLNHLNTFSDPSLEKLVAFEEMIMAQLIRGLPFKHRLALLREARASGEAQTLSLGGRKLSRRFRRGVLIRKQLDLPTFW